LASLSSLSSIAIILAILTIDAAKRNRAFKNISAQVLLIGSKAGLALKRESKANAREFEQAKLS